jgi:hypothetical protein
MPRTSGSTAEAQQQRIDRALDLLESGFNLRKTKELLVAEFAVSQRTADRDCKKASELYYSEAIALDLPTELRKIYATQRNQAALAASVGDLEAARKWNNDARTTAIQLWRLDPTNPATWNKTLTLGLVEPHAPPSEKQRRAYRTSIKDLPDNCPY